MQVQLYIAKGPGNETIREMVKKAVTDTALRMELPLEHINTIAIAWEDQYADAVTDLFASGFTNTEAYVGVAKTQTIFENGRPQHTLLFKSFVFELILRGLDASQSVHDWPPEFQMGPYIISHELGHCKDAEIRGISSESEKLELPHGFDLDIIHGYYFKNLISEFFACLNGDRFYSLDLCEYQATQDFDALSRIQSKVLKARQDHGDPHRIDRVAVEASGLVWTYVIQYAKLWAGKYRTTFESEPIPDILTHEFPNPAIIERLNGFLQNLSDSYPEVSDSFLPTFLPIWNSLALHIGYKFEKIGQQWACYWNEQSQ